MLHALVPAFSIVGYTFVRFGMWIGESGNSPAAGRTGDKKREAGIRPDNLY